MFSQNGELRPTSGWDLLSSLGHPSKFQRVLRLGSVTARHSSSGRQPNFVVLNRAPPIFGRAAITLGIDPHSSSIFFLAYSQPSQIGRIPYFYTWCDLVRIYDAGLKRAVHGSLKIQDAKKSPKIAIWTPSHKYVGLYNRPIYIFANEARIDNRKKTC